MTGDNKNKLLIAAVGPGEHIHYDLHGTQYVGVALSQVEGDGIVTVAVNNGTFRVPPPLKGALYRDRVCTVFVDLHVQGDGGTWEIKTQCGVYNFGVFGTMEAALAAVPFTDEAISCLVCLAQ